MRILGLSIAAVAAVLIAGCGHDADEAVAPTPAASGTPQMSDLQAPPQRLVIDATIKGGELIPADRHLSAAVGETVVVRVNSDADDELRVDSTPVHTFAVSARSNQSFQFSVGSAGTVAITLKKLNQTVATVQVR